MPMLALSLLIYFSILGDAMFEYNVLWGLTKILGFLAVYGIHVGLDKLFGYITIWPLYIEWALGLDSRQKSL